jgi:hypothetical protein
MARVTGLDAAFRFPVLRASRTSFSTRPLRIRSKAAKADSIRVGQLFGPLARATAELADSYSDKELALILEFMRRARERSTEYAAKLRAST